MRSITVIDMETKLSFIVDANDSVTMYIGDLYTGSLNSHDDFVVRTDGMYKAIIHYDGQSEETFIISLKEGYVARCDSNGVEEIHHTFNEDELASIYSLEDLVLKTAHVRASNLDMTDI